MERGHWCGMQFWTKGGKASEPSKDQTVGVKQEGRGQGPTYERMT